MLLKQFLFMQICIHYFDIIPTLGEYYLEGTGFSGMKRKS